MGFRFSRRLRILSGIRLNVSKSGVSTSIGSRGAWLTFGKRGTRATVGLPGTGLSYSQQIGPAHRQSTKAGSEMEARPAPRPQTTGTSGASVFIRIVVILLIVWALSQARH